MTLGPEPSRLPERAQHVIVGGGVVGLGIAHELAKRGITDVVAVDRGYVLAGASGRNGGGVRAQWTTVENVELVHRPPLAPVPLGLLAGEENMD